MPENFKKDTVISGGTKKYPYHKEIGEYKCIKCGVDAKKISSEDKSCGFVTDRGKFRTIWTEITLQCPKCGEKESYDTNHDEVDDNYYSNEERRAFRIR